MILKHKETLPYGLDNNPFIRVFIKCINMIDGHELKNDLEDSMRSFFLENVLSCFRIREELVKELQDIESQIKIHKKPAYFVDDVRGKARDFIVKAYLANKEVINILFLLFKQGSRNKPDVLYSKTIEWAKENNDFELSEYLINFSSQIKYIVNYRSRIEHPKKGDSLKIHNIRYKPILEPPTWDLFGTQTYIIEDMDKVISLLISAYEKILQFGIRYCK